MGSVSLLRNRFGRTQLEEVNLRVCFHMFGLFDLVGCALASFDPNARFARLALYHGGSPLHASIRSERSASRWLNLPFHSRLNDAVELDRTIWQRHRAFYALNCLVLRTCKAGTVF